jgi:hypothetical protein
LDQYPLGPLNRIVMMGSWAYHQHAPPPRRPAGRPPPSPPEAQPHTQRQAPGRAHAKPTTAVPDQRQSSRAPPRLARLLARIENERGMHASMPACPVVAAQDTTRPRLAKHVRVYGIRVLAYSRRGLLCWAGMEAAEIGGTQDGGAIPPKAQTYPPFPSQSGPGPRCSGH